jgi:ribonuclease Y
MIDILSQPLVVGTGAALSSGVVAFFVTKKFVLSRLDMYENTAIAKAKTIEHEAELMLHKSKLQIQEAALESKRALEAELSAARNASDARCCEMEAKETQKLVELKLREEKVAEQEQLINQELKKVEREMLFYTQEKEHLKSEQDRVVKLLEKQAGMTVDEAVQSLLEEAKTHQRSKLANEMRKIEEQSKQELKRKADFILAQATTRFAGDFASERLVNRVSLPDNDLKGRIIGKEGRNIKILESLLGVDIIIDETPNIIELSSHNLYRRAIATRTIELLIEDGRIQPARIEEIYEKVRDEFESRLVDEGEEVIAQLGLSSMHPELVKMIGKLRYRASYGQNALAHTLEVAHFSGLIAAELGGNETLARRAGLLHDIGKAMTHELGGNHVDIGADMCRRHHEDPVVINAIYAHHDQQEVESIECAAVCAADALSAARPGARREVLESYIKRVTEIEQTAMSHHGVKQAYAINAGREVRVIVNAELLNEAESSLVATEIASQIEQGMNFPGEIKVHVIREERFVAIAK